jgi:hypothetical protein
MLLFRTVVFTASIVNLLLFITYLCEVFPEEIMRVNTVDLTHQKSSICTMVYIAGIIHLALEFLTILYRTDLLLQIQCLNEKLRTEHCHQSSYC